MFYKMARFIKNYRNPLSIFVKRNLLGKIGEMVVIDRKSGLKLKTMAGTYRMFGEVFHDRDYEIPWLKYSPDDIVIDIGANHGAYSIAMAAKGCKVYAFEPSPRNFNLLLHNLQMNNLSDQVHCIPKAVAKTSGKMSFYDSDERGGGISALATYANSETLKGNPPKTEVETITLQQFMAENNIDKVKTLKLDCEGAEYEILKSLDMQSLQKIESIVMEFHLGVYDLEDFMSHLIKLEPYSVSLAEDKYCRRNILRLVSKQTLLQFWKQ